MFSFGVFGRPVSCYWGIRMALIWRCASAVAKESLVQRVPVCALLKPLGWEIPRGYEPPEDPTAKELAEWVREVAQKT